MRAAFFILPLLVFALVLSLGPLALAQETFTIVIPSGASDPDAPYFWSEKSTGVTTGKIVVYPNDSVTWKNADTAFHTITSVTQSGKIDGIFDSGMINAGESYSRQFVNLGDFYYFCSLHPWMNGVVQVVKNPGSVQSIDNVGSGYSDDGLGFEVKYILDTSLQPDVHIDSAENTLTFRVSGKTENEQLVIVLPTELIENPNAVWVDGMMSDLQADSVAAGTKLTVPIAPHSEEIKIMGTRVIPEFGFLALGILSAGLASTVFLIRSKFSAV